MNTLLNELLPLLAHKARSWGYNFDKKIITYKIGGFSKSGDGTLYELDGQVYLDTRYDQTDTINSYDDIVWVAWRWNDNYTERGYGYAEEWADDFKRLGLLKEVIKTELVKA